MTVDDSDPQIEEFLTIKVHYTNLQALQIVKEESDEYEDIVLLYFSLEPDTTERPIALSKSQAEQLYHDLAQLF